MLNFLGVRTGLLFIKSTKQKERGDYTATPHGGEGWLQDHFFFFFLKKNIASMKSTPHMFVFSQNKHV